MLSLNEPRMTWTVSIDKLSEDNNIDFCRIALPGDWARRLRPVSRMANVHMYFRCLMIQEKQLGV